jgi:type I restriction enzyme M protein
MMSFNERKTEDLIDARLRKQGYYRPDSGIIVEKQTSDIPRIKKLLENASKHGGGIGKPEFLIHSKSQPDFLMVVECKANPQKHVSTTLDRYDDYAVDGVLLYASFLSKEFDVLAIAASGQHEASFRISQYFHLRRTPKAVEFDGARDMVSLEEYYDAFIHSDAKFRQDYSIFFLPDAICSAYGCRTTNVLIIAIYNRSVSVHKFKRAKRGRRPFQLSQDSRTP